MPQAPYSPSTTGHTTGRSNAKAARYVVVHYHAPILEDGLTVAPAEEVYATYSTEMPDALSYAIHTAVRYQGTIYSEAPEYDGDNRPILTFFRSYRPGSARANRG